MTARLSGEDAARQELAAVYQLLDELLARLESPPEFLALVSPPWADWLSDTHGYYHARRNQLRDQGEVR